MKTEKRNPGELNGSQVQDCCPDSYDFIKIIPKQSIYYIDTLGDLYFGICRVSCSLYDARTKRLVGHFIDKGGGIPIFLEDNDPELELELYTTIPNRPDTVSECMLKYILSFIHTIPDLKRLREELDYWGISKVYLPFVEEYTSEIKDILNEHESRLK